MILTLYILKKAIENGIYDINEIPRCYNTYMNMSKTLLTDVSFYKLYVCDNISNDIVEIITIELIYIKLKKIKKILNRFIYNYKIKKSIKYLEKDLFFNDLNIYNKKHIVKIYQNKNKINFLDIGFGSGCILLSILKERKNFKGTGVDVSKYALKVCEINAFKLGVKNRLKLYNSNIDKFKLGKYDLVISNPPYIKNLDLKYLEKDVKKFEPKLALDGGLDGISEIRKVIKKSSELIKNGGKLILEIAYNQTYEVKNLLKKNSFYINSVVKDLAKNDRCIISTKIEN